MEPIAPLSPVELRARTEYLGLSQQDLAQLLDVQDRTVRRWLAGMTPIPVWLIDTLAQWEEATREVVQVMSMSLYADPDKILPATRPEGEQSDMPDRWWRHVLARVLEMCPEASIV